MSVRSRNTAEAGEPSPSKVLTRAVLVVTALSAVAAAIRPCRPIGSNIADRSYTAGFAALVAYCGATASLLALAWAALVLAVFGGSIALHALGLLMLACLAVLGRRGKLDPVAGADPTARSGASCADAAVDATALLAATARRVWRSRSRRRGNDRPQHGHLRAAARREPLGHPGDQAARPPRAPGRLPVRR